MTVDAGSETSEAIGRFAVKLPYHEDKVERMVLGILRLFGRLRALESFEPDPQNSRLFNQLFDLVTQSKITTLDEQKILNDPRVLPIIPQLWDIWGTAEYLLERAFARKVINGSSSASHLQIYNTFPYLSQYRQLARMEFNTLDTAIGEKELPPIRRIAFLGSGPTPFSSLCFRERYGPTVSMLNIDRNPEAIYFGSRLVDALGYNDSIQFAQAEVANVDGQGELALPNLRDCDVVHFAAMIGGTEQEKRELLLRVAEGMRPGTLILIRSTDSLRTILYPSMDIDREEILQVMSPVLATKYFGASTSLTAIIVSVDARISTEKRSSQL